MNEIENLQSQLDEQSQRIDALNLTLAFLISKQEDETLASMLKYLRLQPEEMASAEEAFAGELRVLAAHIDGVLQLESSPKA